VQIGDPITEKKVLDVLIQARDAGLYSAITDCGAGGLSSAVGEMGETHEVRGLYVADGSACVTSTGVNPMITIMAIADHVTRGILESW